MSNTPPDPELSEESPPTDSRRRAVQKAVETFLRHVRRVVTRSSPATDAAPTPVVVTDGGQADAKVIGHNQESGQTVGVWPELSVLWPITLASAWPPSVTTTGVGAA